MHVFRWDLDRTYLDTDIHSVRGMLRSALETAADKRTIPGADALLRGLVDHDPEARVAILSGSPTQMRTVLEEKLALDGIRVDSLVLKDNLRNITRGRFRAVRGQLGYKLPQLLAHRLAEPVGTTESLFGDDAEVDALVYVLYADAIAGRVDEDTLARVMRRGSAYDDQIDHALRSMRRLRDEDAVTDIWIHVDRRLPLADFHRLGGLVRVVFSWYQAALALFEADRLSPTGVEKVARRVSSEGETGPMQLAALAQDAVRRGLVSRQAVLDLLQRAPALEPAAAATERALDLLGASRVRTPDPSLRDYEGFLAASTRG